MTPLPERINRLDSLAKDLSWSWIPEARQVFRRLDYATWRMNVAQQIAGAQRAAAIGGPEFQKR